MTLLFIFDMDDVLVDYDWRTRMAGLTELTGLPLGELRRRWWHDRGELLAEAGGFDGPDAYLAAFREAIHPDITEDDWVRIRGAAMTARPDAIAAVRQAGELGQVTLLTNNGPLTQKHLRTLAPEVAEVFGDHLYTSSHYGARKPDPVVFERVLDAYGVRAAEAFFADDLEENIAGAASVGITTYHYGDARGLLAAIEAFAAARS